MLDKLTEWNHRNNISGMFAIHGKSYYRIKHNK